MIDRLHGEVEGHEFDDRPQATHRRAGPKARKTIFSDWGVDDSLRPELLEQALRHLIRTLIFGDRSEEHTSELQSLMRISYAVFCLKKKKEYKNRNTIKRYIVHNENPHSRTTLRNRLIKL